MRQSEDRGAFEATPVFYGWNIPGDPMSIQLSLEVIDRLGADVMEGFSAAPKRSAEIGGILLGGVSGGEGERVIVIEDYEPVRCQHRRGLSYVLSESDRRRLKRALHRASKRTRVVGFFRSHMRLGLYLDRDDMSLVETFFPNPSQVVLLVRPHAAKPLTAGFFFWEEGGIYCQKTYREFPFSRAEILNETGAIPAEEALRASSRASAAA